MEGGSKITIVTGKSGTDKTEYVLKKLIDRSKEPSHEGLFLVVPEQFTMQSQKKLTRLHPEHVVMDIDIVSFLRLAVRIFDEQAVKTDQVLEDIGKTMVITYVLEKLKDDLSIYKNVYKTYGFVDQMKSMLSELFQYGITKEDVRETIKELDPNLPVSRKLTDLLLVYEEFESFIDGHYIVAEKLMTLCGDYVASSKKLDGAIVVFDGFTGFTPVQYQFLEKLKNVCSEMIFTITMPELEPSFKEEHSLFHMSYEYYQRIMNLSKDGGICDIKIISLDKEKSIFESKEIAHLEDNIFKYPFNKWNEEPKSIFLNPCASRNDELKYVAREIKRLVMDEGFRYRDIAVLSGELADITYIISGVMADYDIPYFIDNTRDMMANPFVIWLTSLLRIETYDYSFDDVFAYLKTGFSKAVSVEEVGLLENYALRRGLKSKKGYMKPSDDEVVENIRLAFLKEMEEFHNLIKGGVVKNYLEGIYRFMCSLNIEDRLSYLSEELEKKGELENAKLYSQLFKKTVELLDKIYSLLGNEHMKREDFLNIFETGLSSISVGILPQGLDKVSFGDVMRSRFDNIKVLFFMGLNEGVVPRSGVRTMLLTDSDRGHIKDKLELAPDTKKRSYEEQFYLYLALTKPTKRLYLSYHMLSDDNKKAKPSYLISRINAIFPKLNTCFDDDHFVYNEAEVFDRLSHYKHEDHIFDGEYYEVLKNLARESGRDILFERGMTFPVWDKKVSKELAKKLYGEDTHITVSRLELYAGCAFSYFLQYGLMLKEKKKYEIDVADTGTILHAVMEGVFKSYADDLQGIRTADIAECIERSRQVLDEVLSADEYVELFSETTRGEFHKKILEGVVETTITSLKNQLSHGKMIPKEFELSFGQHGRNNSYLTLDLKDGIKLKLKGVVDRVDIYFDEDDKKLYVQVIDYKSGAKDINYTKLFYGTQVQLPVYMNVVKEWAKTKYPGYEVLPVGMYYYHLQNPLIDLEDGQDYEKELKKRLRLSGETVGEKKVIELIDNGPGDVVNVRFKKDGEFDANSKVVEKRELDAICDYAEKKLVEISERMFDGEIPAEPYYYKKVTACEYCPYKEICLFDPTIKGFKYRFFKDQDKTMITKTEKEE
ncbi:MAG: exodeoxyribonuclease V subunit gamma [Lachnospiraceae bacterium]|nr:exodeoxyribonuclease V subunit gamma [Lachnospiraceae bacterium]